MMGILLFLPLAVIGMAGYEYVRHKRQGKNTWHNDDWGKRPHEQKAMMKASGAVQVPDHRGLLISRCQPFSLSFCILQFCTSSQLPAPIFHSHCTLDLQSTLPCSTN